MKHRVLVPFLLTLLSCSHHQKSEMISDASEATSVNTIPQHQNIFDKNEKLIKTAEYRFKSDNVKQTSEAVEASIKKYPAVISSSDLTLEHNVLEMTMTIKVETNYFLELLKEIDQNAAHVHYRKIRTEDVSKEFVDLQSRLKTKREVQERLKEILRKKAGTIEELLAAENQIGELQEEIEATVSRINYLKDKVAYSTINLSFYEEVKEPIAQMEQYNVWTEFGDAFAIGFKGLINFFFAFVQIWPILFCIGAVLWFIKHRRKESVKLL